MRITGLKTFVAEVPLVDGSTDMCFAADGAVVMNETSV